MKHRNLALRGKRDAGGSSSENVVVTNKLRDGYLADDRRAAKSQLRNEAQETEIWMPVRQDTSDCPQ